MTAGHTEELVRSIGEIEALDRSGCLDRWREVFGRPPPKYLSPQFMRRVLLWELQERMLGGISRRTERTLARIAAGKASPAPAKPGSHLVREWNGRTYQVEVFDGGYVMDGKTFTEIAQAEGTSKRRVQDIVDLATLAPELLDAIAKGEQPAHVSSDYLIKTGFPAIWSEQRRHFAGL